MARSSVTVPFPAQEADMFRSHYSFHHRRARHHGLFARGAVDARVRSAHECLASCYQMLASLNRTPREV